MAENLNVTVLGLESAVARIPDDARRAAAEVRILQRVGVLMQAEARKRIPKRTGATAASVTTRVVSSNSIAVGTRSPVGKWLDEGTGLFGPHQQRIYPTNGRFLRWPAGQSGPGGNLRLTGQPRKQAAGVYNYATSIAGMHKQPWVEKAFYAAQPGVPLILVEEGRALVSVTR